MVLQNYFQDVIDTIPQDASLNLPVCKENSLEIKFEKNEEIKTIYSGSEPSLPFANSNVFHANISCWRRLTAENEDCKTVYEITLDIQDSNFTFKAGDTIGIIPENDEEDINSVLTHLDLTSLADTCYTLTTNNTQKANKIPIHVPVKSTVRYVLQHCVDLRSVLKKLFLLALSRHTKNEIERRIIEYFCSKEGSTAYQTHILNRNLCILDIFAIFKSCKPPIEILLAHLPRLLPRPYSIVNTGQTEAKVIKICFSVLPSVNNRKGVTTGWLERLILEKDNLENRIENLTIDNGSDIKKYKVPIYLRKNLAGFSLPENMATSLILIGPGTGVAPFVGFLEERELYKYSNPESELGDAWLFFGCRNPVLDIIYEKELNEYLQKGCLTKLCTAFSRVDNNGVKYIQDALLKNSEQITQLIESKASIFVCGDLKNVAASVQNAFVQCLVKSGKTLDEATQLISDLQKNKKYIVDAWS